MTSKNEQGLRETGLLKVKCWVSLLPLSLNFLIMCRERDKSYICSGLVQFEKKKRIPLRQVWMANKEIK